MRHGDSYAKIISAGLESDPICTRYVFCKEKDLAKAKENSTVSKNASEESEILFS